MFGTGEGLLGYEPHSETCSVQERGLWGTDYSPEHVWYRRGASDVRNAPQNTLGIGKWAIVCRINEKRIPVQEGLLRYGTGSGARLVHGRGFCGTERDGGHGWYTTMGTGVRNVRKEGFIHKMKPHRSQHAADETGVRRKRRRKKRWKGRRRKGLRDQYCRGPKMEVPMRTMLAPWRMARGQSWDIPMESSVKSVSWG